jgi:hypothetical protein
LLPQANEGIEKAVSKSEEERSIKIVWKYKTSVWLI